MGFKISIIRNKPDGTEEKITVENSEPLTDQQHLLSWLDPWLYPERSMEPETKVVLTATEMQYKDFHESMQQVEEEPAVIKQADPEPDPPEKYTGRETGVAQIHCPSCGLQTAKHTPIKANYIPCPKCKEKLFLFALNEVRGEPDAMGISFRANGVYMTARERWELNNPQE